MTAVARLTWLVAALALTCTDPARAQTGKRPACETIGSWRVCHSEMMLHSSSKSGYVPHVVRDGEKIGGDAFITIRQPKNSQLRADLRILFLQSDRKDRARIIADGIVLDTIEQDGRVYSYDLKSRFGDMLQGLRSGDDAAKRPPVGNLKVVMTIDGEDLTIFDVALAETEKALQRYHAMAAVAPNPLGQQARKPSQEPVAKDRDVARKSDEPQPPPRPPAIALPTTPEECNAVPDALQKALDTSRQRIDHLYFFGRESIIGACQHGGFARAQELALEILRRRSTTRRPPVLLYRELSKSIPRSRDPQVCNNIWNRVMGHVPVDDIDGEEAVSDPIRRACDARDFGQAHDRMTRHVDNEVKRVLDYFDRPGGPYGSGRQ